MLARIKLIFESTEWFTGQRVTTTALGGEEDIGVSVVTVVRTVM